MLVVLLLVVVFPFYLTLLREMSSGTEQRKMDKFIVEELPLRGTQNRVVLPHRFRGMATVYCVTSALTGLRTYVHHQSPLWSEKTSQEAAQMAQELADVFTKDIKKACAYAWYDDKAERKTLQASYEDVPTSYSVARVYRDGSRLPQYAIRRDCDGSLSVLAKLDRKDAELFVAGLLNANVLHYSLVYSLGWYPDDRKGVVSTVCRGVGTKFSTLFKLFLTREGRC